MKTEKKFTWCIRYYNVKIGNVESHKDYEVCLFKQFKEF